MLTLVDMLSEEEIEKRLEGVLFEHGIERGL